MPYTLYGKHPGDWTEGANAGMRYQLQFARVPTAEERVKLAETFEAKTITSPVDTVAVPQWRWSGPWLAFAVGVDAGFEEDDDLASDEMYNEFFASMRSAIAAMDKVVPLAQARFVNSRDVADAAGEKAPESGYESFPEVEAAAKKVRAGREAAPTWWAKLHAEIDGQDE